MITSTAQALSRRDPAVEAAKARQLADAHRAVCPVCRAGANQIVRR
jgi:hypothetical protein